jgi:uncharacterized protein YutE (UPF0331/DUF86 family)
VIDKELVTRKIVLITDDLKALEPLGRKPLADYLASAIDEVLAERYLERIIGRMIDLNYHVLTESGQAPPKDYYQSFTALADIGLLDREFAGRIAACAGLRNRITHEYETIDPALVHGALQAALQDIPVYLRGLADHVGL